MIEVLLHIVKDDCNNNGERLKHFDLDSFHFMGTCYLAYDCFAIGNASSLNDANGGEYWVIMDVRIYILWLSFVNDI